jgi:restriction system protein
MKSKTISESIISVLKTQIDPISPKEILKKISEECLYNFKSKNPESIVRATLRKHCINISYPLSSKQKLFLVTSDGKFKLID